MIEKTAGEILAKFGKKLVETDLVQGTWGNLSLRLDEKYMMVTPSGLDYTRLTPSDMVKVDINSLEYAGDLKPTSEKGIHGGIYGSRPDVGAVIHTHSKYCAVFAAARKAVPIETGRGGKDIRPYSRTGRLRHAGVEGALGGHHCRPR